MANENQPQDPQKEIKIDGKITPEEVEIAEINKLAKLRIALICFVVIATAARESGVVPDPWGKFIGLIVAGMYTWGLVKKPNG